MVEVHKILLNKIPCFDKEVDPHICSKIKWRKEKYNPISDMCLQSGCQWDDVEHKINCEKQWYDDWLNHKNAVGLWNFRFSYLKELDFVWGKDRATRLKAEDIAEASANVYYPKNVTMCSSDSLDIMISHSKEPPATSSSTRTTKRRKKTFTKEGELFQEKKTSNSSTIN